MWFSFIEFEGKRKKFIFVFNLGNTYNIYIIHLYTTVLNIFEF